MRALALAAALAALAHAGCSGDEAAACRLGGDCASGVCLSSGICQVKADGGKIIPLPDASDLGTWDAGGNGPADAALAGPDASPAATADAGAPDGMVVTVADGGTQSCLPNNDGTITAAELPVVLGAHMTYRIAQNVTLPTGFLAGTQKPDGSLVWDFTAAMSGDHDVQFEPAALAGQWFAKDFSSGQFTLRMSGADDTLGVFAQSTDGLELAGMASPTQSSTPTEFSFNNGDWDTVLDFASDPVSIQTLAYPLKVGSTWTSKGVIHGDYNGDTYNCDPIPPLTNCTPGYPDYDCCVRQTYESQVDATGQAITPYATFDVLRVKTTVTVEVFMTGLWIAASDPTSGQGENVIQYSFISECFGPVAVVNSQKGETEDPFTTAAEVRRLAP